MVEILYLNAINKYKKPSGDLPKSVTLKLWYFLSLDLFSISFAKVALIDFRDEERQIVRNSLKLFLMNEFEAASCGLPVTPM